MSVGNKRLEFSVQSCSTKKPLSNHSISTLNDYDKDGGIQKVLVRTTNHDNSTIAKSIQLDPDG